MTWLHGGVPGLTVGDWIESPDVTGTDHTLSAHAPEDAPHGRRTDVVYLTPRAESARVFAAIYPDGAVYRVIPEGDMEPDPDAPNEAVMVRRAQVVEVVRERVVFAHRTLDSWLRMLTQVGRG